MARRNPSNEPFQLPPVTPGEWKGEIVGRGSANIGQVVQHEPSRRSVEFSYIILPALLDMPSPKVRWPCTVIMAPTPMKAVYEDAGSLIKAGDKPLLTLALDVTREQFSDILRLHEARRLQAFHFTVEAQRGDDPHSWPIHGWGMSVSMEAR